MSPCFVNGRAFWCFGLSMDRNKVITGGLIQAERALDYEKSKESLVLSFCQKSSLADDPILILNYFFFFFFFLKSRKLMSKCFLQYSVISVQT